MEVRLRVTGLVLGLGARSSPGMVTRSDGKFNCRARSSRVVRMALKRREGYSWRGRSSLQRANVQFHVAFVYGC